MAETGALRMGAAREEASARVIGAVRIGDGGGEGGGGGRTGEGGGGEGAAGGGGNGGGGGGRVAAVATNAVVGSGAGVDALTA